MGAFRVQQSLLLSSLLVAVFQPRIMLAAVGNRYTGRFLVKLSFFSSFRHLILTDLFLILPPRLVSYVLCLLSYVFCLLSLLFGLCSLLFGLWSFIFYLSYPPLVPVPNLFREVRGHFPTKTTNYRSRVLPSPYT